VTALQVEAINAGRAPLPFLIARDPGLAVALGGAGITLADLVRLYAALSNGGEVMPLRYLSDEPPVSGTPIFGPLGAWYVNDILAEAPAPPGVLPAEARRGRRLAFKTGTSYGFRDFWAVGYDPEVTIGVWAGRADGTPMPGRSGRLTAAPILFKIADLLGPAMPQKEAPPPRDSASNLSVPGHGRGRSGIGANEPMARRSTNAQDCPRAVIEGATRREGDLTQTLCGPHSITRRAGWMGASGTL
jgi:membrane carboxypeptidase/penicillin-binding protein PbpC